MSCLLFSLVCLRVGFLMITCSGSLVHVHLLRMNSVHVLNYLSAACSNISARLFVNPFCACDGTPAGNRHTFWGGKCRNNADISSHDLWQTKRMGLQPYKNLQLKDPKYRKARRSKPGIKMVVIPEPCKELRRRPQLFVVGLVPD